MAIPTSVAIAVVVVMTISLACDASTVGSKAYGSKASMRRFMEPDKRNYECAAQGAKCFNSRQCCDGLICAALDADDGNKPEIPGYCVKSKDLQVCSVGGGSDPVDECPSGHRCLVLGRMGQTYCLPVGTGAQQPDSQAMMTDRRRYYHGSGASRAIGKFGSTCVTDFDCAPRSEDGTQRMCCQLVNKGRQGTKRMCDKVTPISACTSV